MASMPASHPPIPELPEDDIADDLPPADGAGLESKAPEEAAEPERPTRVRLDTPAEHDTALIEERSDLARVAEHVAGCAEVAIDTEANSMYAYQEQTCILQITAGGRSAIVDVLAVGDLSSLREALDRKDVEIVLHGGDYDVTVLTRDHDFRFDRVFDTMIAATLLGDDRLGLAALVEDHFDHKLNKRFQRADWAKRPLTPDQLDYLRRDTMYLPSLRAHYAERLAEADLVEEAAIEFRRIASRQGKPRVVDADGWRRIKGSGRLDSRGRSILRELFLWREGQAEKRDVPPFKVFPPKAMLELAERCKKTPRSPNDLPGVNDGYRRRLGRILQEKVSRGIAQDEAGQAPAKSDRPKLSQEEARAARSQRNREDAFRTWRRDEARRRDVPTMVVLPNPGLVWMARERPTQVEDLEACVDLGAKRVERYGVRWIEILRKA